MQRPTVTRSGVFFLRRGGGSTDAAANFRCRNPSGERQDGEDDDDHDD